MLTEGGTAIPQLDNLLGKYRLLTIESNKDIVPQGEEKVSFFSGGSLPFCHYESTYRIYLKHNKVGRASMIVRCYKEAIFGPSFKGEPKEEDCQKEIVFDTDIKGVFPTIINLRGTSVERSGGPRSFGRGRCA